VVNSTGVPPSDVTVFWLDGTASGSGILATPYIISVSSNAGTASSGYSASIFTNSSAAAMTITLPTSGLTAANNGQLLRIVIYDYSAVAQTITWTNTENSSITAPTTSNGSTTSPLTVGFQWNNSTSKWRCIAYS
jgi:hypothetical protein